MNDEAGSVTDTAVDEFKKLADEGFDYVEDFADRLTAQASAVENKMKRLALSTAANAFSAGVKALIGSFRHAFDIPDDYAGDAD